MDFLLPLPLRLDLLLGLCTVTVAAALRSKHSWAKGPLEEHPATEGLETKAVTACNACWHSTQSEEAMGSKNATGAER